MSYILEALKKSERERNVGDIPTINPNLEKSSDNSKTRWIIGLLGLVLVANIALIFYWYQQNLDERRTRQLRENQTLAQNKIAPIPTSPTPPIKEPLHTPEAVSKTESNKPKTNPNIDTTTNHTNSENDTPTQATPSPQVKHLFDLPPVFQAKVPTLEYSSHWFSENDKSRNVIINNRSLKEGDWINSNIQVVKIQQDRVTLKLEEQWFTLLALESWQ